MAQSADKSQAIAAACDRINSLQNAVRNHINTTRYQSELLKNSSNWNQICSSLDVIGDTILSILDYTCAEYPDDSGLKYIYTYGILQALFIQQDAMKHLSEAFGISFEQSEKLKKIRTIRNAAIGHPTKNNVKSINYYNYISRISLHKWGFTLLQSSGKNDSHFITVKLDDLMSEQIQEIASAHTALNEKLAEADKAHREKFEGNLVADVFQSSINYLFEKVAEGIHSPDDANRSFGLAMLELVGKTYDKFESSLAERGELNDYVKFDLVEYRHAIQMLRAYLSTGTPSMGETDARIYCFYIREQHAHFEKIAEEIDEEYRRAK